MASFLLDERGWFLELPCIPPDFLAVLRKFHNGLLLHAFRMKSTDDLTPHCMWLRVGYSPYSLSEY